MSTLAHYTQARSLKEDTTVEAIVNLHVKIAESKGNEEVPTYVKMEKKEFKEGWGFVETKHELKKDSIGVIVGNMTDGRLMIYNSYVSKYHTLYRVYANFTALQEAFELPDSSVSRINELVVTCEREKKIRKHK